MAERLPNNIKTGQMYTFESISAIPVNECFALRIYRFPSLFVSICEARSPRKSTNAKSVKTEKRNILRLSSAPSSCNGNAKSFDTSPLLRKRGLRSTTSYFTSSNGLKRIVP